MTEYDIVGLCFVLVAFAAVAPFLFSRRKPAEMQSNNPAFWEDPYAEVAKTISLDRARKRFHDGGPVSGPRPYHTGRFDAKPRPFGKRQPSIFLTARQLEHINIQRRISGRSPLNRDGFTNAVARASVEPIRQPSTTNDWITYLMLYEVLAQDHMADRVSCHTGLTITPDAPYNGHGGEFAGAGASGSWTSPNDTTAAAAASIGALGGFSTVPKTEADYDTLSRGTFHNATIDPGATITGSVMGASDYSTPAAPTDTSSSAPADTGSSCSVDTGSSGAPDMGSC